MYTHFGKTGVRQQVIQTSLESADRLYLKNIFKNKNRNVWRM